MEVWKPIPGYEKSYAVSSMGRVKSLPRLVKHPRNPNMTLPRKGRILKYGLDKYGYPMVVLSQNGKTRPFKVHKLVALAFIPNPDNLPQIDHINAKKYDNRPENLRWCTTQQNSKWRDEKYRIGERARHKVICKETGKEFRSTYDAAFWVISQGIPQKTTNYKTVAKSIRAACTGRYKFSYTYHWAYIEGSTTISKESRGESSEMANSA